MGRETRIATPALALLLLVTLTLIVGTLAAASVGSFYGHETGLPATHLREAKGGSVFDNTWGTAFGGPADVGSGPDVSTTLSVEAGPMPSAPGGRGEAFVSLAMTADTARVAAGAVVTYSIWFNNTGRVAAAGVWIHDALPMGLAYDSDTASTSDGARVESTTWLFADVGPGSHAFLVKLSVDAGVAPASLLVNRATLGYTNIQGLPMPGSSASVAITVTGTLVGAAGLGRVPPTIMLATVLAWILLVAFLPQGKLEQIFLVDYSGVLIAHASRVSASSRDHDVFVGMLTAVQAFVRDSFAGGREGDLKRVDFGHRKIYIRRGGLAYLAVVLEGRTPPALGRTMTRTLTRIEATYGKALAEWRGDVSRVEGTSEMLSATLLD